MFPEEQNSTHCSLLMSWFDETKTQRCLLPVGIAKGMADPGPFNIRRAFYRLLFGLPFLNNGILSQLSNMGVIARRDPDDPEADPPLRVVF